MKPMLSVSSKPLKYCWHVFSSKAGGGEGGNSGIRKAVGSVTALCSGDSRFPLHEAGSVSRDSLGAV